MIIIGTAVVTLLLSLFVVISIFNRKDDKPLVTEVTMCDVDDSGLCIVTFGANNLDRMVINFQLPDAEYPAFYIKASNRGIVNVYSCEVSETVSTHVYLDCTGIRTPLGETINIEVYATDGDTLIARGEFIVSAILLPSQINLTPSPDPSPTQAATATQPQETSTPQEDFSDP